MSKERFSSEDYGSGYYTEIFDSHKELDMTLYNPSKLLTVTELVDMLNSLYDENKKLRLMIKANVNGVYREGSLFDLQFKAIAYDDITKVEINYDFEPKLIIYYKKGKKENVKSFRMFIPYGIDFEFQEVNE